MNPDGIFLGIDFGTGGCKITAVSETGAFLGEAATEYVTEFAQPGWSEQNPADWYEAMCVSLKKLKESGLDFRKIRAVAFDGSTHNAVLLDEAMNPVRKTIMWTDRRSTEECAFLERELGEHIFRTAYQMPAPTWTLPQMMWLKKHEPEVLKKTKHVLFVKDYVRYQVTGHAATDYIEAQGTLFYDMAKRNWADDLDSFPVWTAARSRNSSAPRTLSAKSHRKPPRKQVCRRELLWCAGHPTPRRKTTGQGRWSPATAS